MGRITDERNCNGGPLDYRIRNLDNPCAAEFVVGFRIVIIYLFRSVGPIEAFLREWPTHHRATHYGSGYISVKLNGYAISLLYSQTLLALVPQHLLEARCGGCLTVGA